MVRLRDADRVVGEKASPARFEVDPGDYAWEVQRDGYLTDRSLARSISVMQKPADTVEVTLTPAGDVRGIVERADAAFRAGRCADAMELYDRVTPPADFRGEASMMWLESRFRYGQCAKREDEFDRALAAFKSILDVRRDQWAAKYEMGLTYCTARQYNDGLRNFREMEGPYLGGVSAEKKQAVRTLARYGSALCNHLDYERQEYPDRFADLRESTIGGFEEFLEAAEPIQGRAPADAQATLRAAVQDAKRRLARLQQ